MNEYTKSIVAQLDEISAATAKRGVRRSAIDIDKLRNGDLLYTVRLVLKPTEGEGGDPPSAVSDLATELRKQVAALWQALDSLLKGPT